MKAEITLVALIVVFFVVTREDFLDQKMLKSGFFDKNLAIFYTQNLVSLKTGSANYAWSAPSFV